MTKMMKMMKKRDVLVVKMKNNTGKRNNTRRINKIDDIGISFQLEQRYYDLLSEEYSIGNWKYYLDGRAKVWVDWDIIDNIGFKIYYQFRWRDASTQIYGDFDWVEDIKSYSKHEIWLEFSYEFVSDILY